MLVNKRNVSTMISPFSKVSIILFNASKPVAGYNIEKTARNMATFLYSYK